MASHETFTHTHPILGPLIGRLVESSTIVHFRNIPYATIPARFRPSQLLSSIPPSFDERPERTYTEYSYGCPGRPHDSSNLPGELPRKYDEFRCLTATISASAKRLEAISTSSIDEVEKVPVMVYIHGGAFTEGAGHISSMHETIRMASLALRESLEVVIVTIGYRLGAFGGLACQDLLDEAKENNDEDIFNQGMFDQRKGLMWIQNNIAGFGGDKERVMVFGESAGSISIAMHLLAGEEKLFSRCAMQSGNIATFAGTLKWDETEALYQKLLRNLGIEVEGSTREERLKRLREVTQEVLWKEWAAAGAAIMEPYYGPEGTFFKKTEEIPYYKNHTEMTAKREWLDVAIVGDDFFEGYIFLGKLQDAKPGPFVKAVKEVFGIENGSKILEAYEINVDGEMDQVAFYMRVMYLIGDIYFQEPTSHMADELAKAYAEKSQEGKKKQKVFRYQFNLPNLFPGSPFSYVVGHHFVEMFYQFMTMRERYPTHRNKFYQRQSEAMARLWIKFANGLDPWDEYKEENGFKISICDDINGWHVRTREEDFEKSMNEQWGQRRYEQWGILRDAFLKLWDEGGNEKVEWARRKLWDDSSYLEPTNDL
ncbi:Acetylcholinesterase [Dactylella cylindrospora]|nr:Acetylcholinesterase [Dactylella cylindrospora]